MKFTVQEQNGVVEDAIESLKHRRWKLRIRHLSSWTTSAALCALFKLIVEPIDEDALVDWTAFTCGFQRELACEHFKWHRYYWVREHCKIEKSALGHNERGFRCHELQHLAGSKKVNDSSYHGQKKKPTWLLLLKSIATVPAAYRFKLRNSDTGRVILRCVPCPSDLRSDHYAPPRSFSPRITAGLLIESVEEDSSRAFVFKFCFGIAVFLRFERLFLILVLRKSYKALFSSFPSSHPQHRSFLRRQYAICYLWVSYLTSDITRSSFSLLFTLSNHEPCHNNPISRNGSLPLDERQRVWRRRSERRRNLQRIRAVRNDEVSISPVILIPFFQYVQWPPK